MRSKTVKTLFVSHICPWKRLGCAKREKLAGGFFSNFRQQASFLVTESNVLSENVVKVNEFVAYAMNAYGAFVHLCFNNCGHKQFAIFSFTFSNNT